MKDKDYLYWYTLGAKWVHEQKQKLGWAGGKGRIKRQIRYHIKEYVNLISNHDAFMDVILDSIN